MEREKLEAAPGGVNPSFDPDNDADSDGVTDTEFDIETGNLRRPRVTMRAMRQRRFALIALLLLGGIASGPAASATPEFVFPAEMPDGRRADLHRLLDNAHAAIAPLRPVLDEPPIIVAWAGNDDEFERMVRLSPEHTIAAAQPDERRIIINGPVFDRAGSRERQTTITHEYAHLFLGMRCSRRLPLWLEEGLAMILSGDTDRASDLRLALARALNRLPALEDLRHSFPGGPGQRDLAYGVAYSVTLFFTRRDYPETGAAGLVRVLTDPERGPRLIDQLWERQINRGLQASWSRSFRGISGWLLFVTSATVIWGGVTLLFLLAYLRRRAHRQAILNEWGEEEAWMESLPDDHWGDPDDS